MGNLVIIKNQDLFVGYFKTAMGRLWLKSW